MLPRIQRVTYTWENITADAEVVQGSCLKRNRLRTQKKILDNGITYSFHLSVELKATFPCAVTGAVQPGELLG